MIAIKKDNTFHPLFRKMEDAIRETIEKHSIKPFSTKNVKVESIPHIEVNEILDFNSTLSRKIFSGNVLTLSFRGNLGLMVEMLFSPFGQQLERLDLYAMEWKVRYENESDTFQIIEPGDLFSTQE